MASGKLKSEGLSTPQSIRQRAAELAHASPIDTSQMSREDVQSLVSKLQINQFELELLKVDSAAAKCNSEGRREQGEPDARSHLQILQGLFIENMPAPIAMFDNQMCYLAVSRRWREDYGLSGQEIIGKNHYEVFPDIPERWKIAHRRALAGEILREEVDSFVRSNGQIEWVKWELLPWHLASGEIGGVILLSEVITQRILAQEAARREREFSEGIINSSHHIVLALNRNGRILRINPFFELLTGWSRAEVEGADWFETFLLERDRQSIRAIFSRALGGNSTRGYVNAIVAKDGREIEVEWYYAPLKGADGEITALICTGQDITERLKSEKALRASEEKLRAVLRTAADAIINIDAKGTITDVNSATVKMFGFEVGELVGQNVSILMPSPYREEHDEFIRRYLETGVPHIIGIGRQVLARHKDGTVFPVSLAVSEVDHLGLFTGIIRDISVLHKLQREILTSTEDENRRIGRELHDGLQQELAGIGLLVQTLCQQLSSDTSPVGNETVKPNALANRIKEGISRIHRELRNVVRGLVPVSLDSEGITNCLRDLAASTDQLQSMQCSFKCEEPIEIEDRETATHLFRIAQEAVANSIKHGRPEHILISLELEDGHPLLSVIDDGVGFKLDQVTSGLGLKTMHYRAGLIGASLVISTPQNGGVKVACKLFGFKNKQAPPSDQHSKTIP